MSGSVIDKATALKHSVSGSSINKIVCKASSHELAGPKKKHVDFLLALTNHHQSDMVAISDMLGERLHNTNWVVVFKALITSHTLMTLGNERYLQALATKTSPFDIESFADKSSVQASEMTPYIHRYSRYLGAICASYRAIVIDFFRMARGDNGPFRTMEATKLLKATGYIQNVLDKLLDFEVSRGELNNGVINTAFTMLYQDLTKVYAAYNDAMINVLEHFFEMKKAQCKDAVECYRKFLTRQHGVSKFLTIAEDVGMDKKKHLNIRQVPEDLLPALEQHLEEMDAIRKSANNKQPSPQIQAASAKLTQLKSKSPTNTSSNGSGRNTPNLASPYDQLPSGNEDILSTQRKRFEDLKKRASDKNIKVDTTNTVSEEDEFTVMATNRSTPQLQQKTNVMDELMSLDSQWTSATTTTTTNNNNNATNPWGAPTTSVPPVSNNPFSVGGAVGGVSNNPWETGTGGYQEIGLFSSGQQPPTNGSTANPLGDILLPMSSGPYASQQTLPQTQKLTTDVDSSLALTANNLSLELGGTKGTGMGTGLGTGMGTGLGTAFGQKKSTHQWGPESVQKSTLTGGPGYLGQRQLQPTTLPPGQMGGASMSTMGGPTANWPTGTYGVNYFPGQPQPQSQNPFGMQPMGGMTTTGFGYNPNPYQTTPYTQQQQQQQTPFQSNNQQPSLF